MACVPCAHRSVIFHRVVNIVRKLDSSGPESSVLICSFVLEVESLIAKHTRHKVRSENDVSDMDEVAARSIHGPRFKNSYTICANFLQPLGPLHTIYLSVLVVLEIAGKLELIRDAHILFLNDITLRVSPADVADSCGERQCSSFVELLLDGIDQHLVDCRIEVIQSALHVVLEEVP